MVKGFPYERWPRVPRRDHDLGARMRRLRPRGQVRAAEITAHRLLGVLPKLTWSTPDRAALSSADQVAIALARSRDGGGPILVTGARALFQALADAALGGEFPPEATVAPPTLDPFAEGALTYLAARCLAPLGDDFQVLGCLEQPDVTRTLGQAAHVRWPVRLDLGEQTAQLTVWVPETALPRVEPDIGRAWRPPAALAGVPIEVAAHAGVTQLRAEELARMDAGDIVLLDRCGLVGAPPDLTGSCALHAIGASNALFGAAVDTTSFTLTRTSPELCPMSDAKQLPQTGRAMPVVACDLPVTLHLELARFSIPLKTLAELAPGDVLDARTPIGQEVTLRAGDVAVAVGELVDFEGDIGVRITRVHLAEAEGPAVE